MGRATTRAGRFLRTLVAPDTALLPKILAAFLVVLALSSLVTLAFETRLTRQQLEEQAATLFAESSEVLEGRIAADAQRVSQLMSTVGQTVFAAADPPPMTPRQDVVGIADVDRRAVTVVSTVRTADEELELLGVVNAATGEMLATGLPTRGAYVPPSAEDARRLASAPGRSQRVVPLEDGGYAVAYVLPVRRIDAEPRLLVTGYRLDATRARRIQAQTGVDVVEIVVDGRVVASTSHHAGEVAAGDPNQQRATQALPDGRLVRYVAVGADRPWDTPAAIGLISDDPLQALDAGLAQTRVLMVLVLVGVGGALAFALARVMTRPILDLTDTATAIAAGDLDREFQVARRDEIGRLGTALEQMRRGLRAQLLVIRRQADALQEAARRIVGAQDRERQRVAQDLHDGIQQQLVVLRMQVGVAAAQLAEHPERRQEITDGLASSIDALLDELRSTGHDLFPSILRDRGLGAAVFSLAGRVDVAVEVVLEPDPLPELESEVAVNAYFLVSEAITNVLKHADAGRIHVEVRHEAYALRVRVRDDGSGFDTSSRGHRGGLVHMRDRVNALGGSLQLVSDPGEGTVVTALFPLAEGSPGGALEVEQDGGDAPVEVDLLGQAELAEDGVGVLLDRSVADRQLPRDGGVAPP